MHKIKRRRGKKTRAVASCINYKLHVVGYQRDCFLGVQWLLWLVEICNFQIIWWMVSNDLMGKL